jgi:hypothetical protein
MKESQLTKEGAKHGAPSPAMQLWKKMLGRKKAAPIRPQLGVDSALAAGLWFSPDEHQCHQDKAVAVMGVKQKQDFCNHVCIQIKTRSPYKPQKWY